MTATKRPIRIWNRSEIGLLAPNVQKLELRLPTEITTDNLGLTWHWTGAGGRLFHPDPLRRLRGIQAAHMAPGGLGTKTGAGDIAYEGAFDADRNVYLLRDARFVGAHALSPANRANRRTNGIVFLEDERGLTPDALDAVTWWADLFRWIERRPPQHFAHSYWARLNGQGTECPGPLGRVVTFMGGKA